MASHSIDPFKIFGIPYEFETPNLDSIYYSLYKKNENLENLNLAYKILTNIEQKLFFLCDFHHTSKPDRDILCDVLNILKENKTKSAKDLAQFKLNESIKFALQNEWQNCWHEFQAYLYLNKNK